VCQADHGKPVIAAFMGGAKVEAANRELRASGVPTCDGPDAAVRTLSRMVGYARWKARPARVVKLFPVNRHRVERIIDRHVRRGEADVGETESKEIIEAYGFATPRGGVATSAQQAADIADQIGYPVVMKVWSPDIVHKTDVSGVRLGLTSRTEVIDAYDLMMYRIPQRAPGAHLLGVLVQQMVGGGQEVILGMSRDPRFGPLMMFGMGGIFVEVLGDVAFHLAPLTAEEAREMLSSTRTWRMLRGERGQERVDVEALAECLQRLSQLVTEFPRIEEMDINPLVVGPPGVSPIAVDASIRLSLEAGADQRGAGSQRR
jgi:acetyltransferase